jgi:AmiR/NasT family two-component response regulator
VKLLRVLVANEHQDRLAELTAVLTGLGHEVVAPQLEVGKVGAVTAREQPDVAFVGLGESSQHALALIEQIVQEAACPVVVILQAPDPTFVAEAARRGVFAYIADDDPQGWQNSIEIVLRRFAELDDLKQAIETPMITEQAKGILMERHTVDEAQAARMLRDEAHHERSRVVDTAQEIVSATEEP